MFEAAGLPFTRDLRHVPSSRKALLVSEYARAAGRYDALHARLFDAYWVRALDLGDEDVLVEEASAAGLDPDGARAAARDERAFAAIEDATRQALELGAGGVPAWRIDGRLLVPGAQPHEVFAGAMTRLGHEPRDG